MIHFHHVSAQSSPPIAHGDIPSARAPIQGLKKEEKTGWKTDGFPVETTIFHGKIYGFLGKSMKTTMFQRKISGFLGKSMETSIFHRKIKGKNTKKLRENHHVLFQ